MLCMLVSSVSLFAMESESPWRSWLAWFSTPSDSVAPTQMEKGWKPSIPQPDILEISRISVCKINSIEDVQDRLSMVKRKFDVVVDSQLQQIQCSINREYIKQPRIIDRFEGHSFELLGGFNDQEVQEEIDAIGQGLVRVLKEKKEGQSLIIDLLKRHLVQIDETRESVSNIMLLQADNDEQLYQGIDSSMNQLDARSIPYPYHSR